MLVNLIEHSCVDEFYVGRQGNSDNMVLHLLRKLKVKYPHISYAVVLERLPGKRDALAPQFFDTIFPEELDTAPFKDIGNVRFRLYDTNISSRIPFDMI